MQFKFFFGSMHLVTSTVTPLVTSGGWRKR